MKMMMMILRFDEATIGLNSLFGCERRESINCNLYFVINIF